MSVIERDGAPDLGDLVLHGDAVVVAVTWAKDGSRGPAVAIILTGDGKSAMGNVSPRLAREVAASLVKCADAVEAGTVPKPAATVLP